MANVFAALAVLAAVTAESEVAANCSFAATFNLSKNVKCVSDPGANDGVLVVGNTESINSAFPAKTGSLRLRARAVGSGNCVLQISTTSPAVDELALKRSDFVAVRDFEAKLPYSSTTAGALTLGVKCDTNHDAQFNLYGLQFVPASPDREEYEAFAHKLGPVLMYVGNPQQKLNDACVVLTKGYANAAKAKKGIDAGVVAFDFAKMMGGRVQLANPFQYDFMSSLENTLKMSRSLPPVKKARLQNIKDRVASFFTDTLDKFSFGLFSTLIEGIKSVAADAYDPGNLIAETQSMVSLNYGAALKRANDGVASFRQASALLDALQRDFTATGKLLVDADVGAIHGRAIAGEYETFLANYRQVANITTQACSVSAGVEIEQRITAARVMAAELSALQGKYSAFSAEVFLFITNVESSALEQNNPFKKTIANEIDEDRQVRERAASQWEGYAKTIRDTVRQTRVDTKKLLDEI